MQTHSIYAGYFQKLVDKSQTRKGDLYVVFDAFQRGKQVSINLALARGETKQSSREVEALKIAYTYSCVN